MKLFHSFDRKQTCITKSSCQSRLSKQGNSTYSYSSQPKAAQRQRFKFRPTVVPPTNESISVGNLMYDRRIVRGNTYAMHSLPTQTPLNLITIQRQQEARQRVAARRKARQFFRTVTPEPVQDRKHINVQTELYLEELTDRVEEADVFIQTDRFLDRPPTPLYIPQATGRDTATQIETGDLFNFNVEVRPIVEVLAGRTVEQALVEVSQEEEMRRMRDQQRDYEESRNAELVELQRSEEQEKRLRTEKDRRMQQEEEVHRAEREAQEKIAARAFSRAYLQDLVPSVFNNLRENGYFYDPVERETEASFIPWLMDQTMSQVNQLNISRTLLDSTIRDVVNQRVDQYQRLNDSLRQSNHSGSRRSSRHGSEKSLQRQKSTSSDHRAPKE
ncbi:unnamed protein product [Adineta ricciae]|uniref:Uncharacterized protein n=1 Tax=Adineta ricciae TaxID=249248 RepID=A0A814FIT3_ADIRI|nr:unnamed protein product [Adineta ricciae]